MAIERDEEFNGSDTEKLSTWICAETSDVSNMILAGKGNSKLKKVLTFYESPPDYKKDYMILLPCKVCRHNLSKFGSPFTITSKTSKVKLNDLYPFPIK